MAVLIYVYPPRKLRHIPKRDAQRFLSAVGVGRAITDQLEDTVSMPYCVSCQEQLQAQASNAKYYSQWISRLWPTWTQYAVDAGFPSELFLRSTRSKRDCSDKTVVAENYAMATCCALFQLARWAVVLKNQSERANAVKVLEHFVRQAGSENSVVWHADWQSQGPCDPLKPVTLSAVPVTVRAGMAKVGPLLRAFPKLRAIVDKETPGAPADLAQLSLPTLLVGLVRAASALAARAAASLCAWLAKCLEASEWVAGASTDPLDVPCPKTRGNKLRLVDQSLKLGVARAACEGRLGRSGRQIALALKRFRPKSYPGLPKKANEWIDILLQSYQNNAIAHFRRQELDFISVSLDGTRLGKREVLLTALCAPETGGTFWCPPRAESLAASETAHFRPPKHTFQASETGRLKTHKNVENGRRKTHKNVENGRRKTHINA